MPLFKVSIKLSFRGTGIVVVPWMSIQAFSPNSMNLTEMGGDILLATP